MVSSKSGAEFISGAASGYCECSGTRNATERESIVRRYHRSLRDIAIENNSADRFYAASYGKEAAFQRDIKPKRARVSPGATIPSEHQSQSAVISWWALNCGRHGLPRFSLFAIPNGGARDAITGSKLKQEGVRAGIPDLMLAVRRDNSAGLFIEMKKPRNYASAEQKEVIEYLHGAGYVCEICYTVDSAISAIEYYLG